MSLKPLCASPDSLKSYTFKEFKGGLFKAIKKLAKKHDKPEVAAPFYLCIEQKFADAEKEFFLVFGKLNAWKKYAKDNAMQVQALRGVCYVSYDETAKCLVLNLMPVAGKLKAKENQIAKAMRTVVNPSRCRVEISKGEFSEEMLDKLAAATETMEDVPDDVAADAIEDQVEQLHELADQAMEDKTLSPAQKMKIQEMNADIEALENLLERLAAADDVAEIKQLDLDIRTVFAKYAK